MKVTHPIAPVWDTGSELLILGSFPSVKSREQGFFYGHPQNRFWRVCAAVFECEVPKSIDDKKKFLTKNHIALWDVISVCDIDGSSDASIRNALPNDISSILKSAPIERIFVNGQTAKRLYDSYLLPRFGREATVLPSTSPANAVWTFEKLTAEWKKIKSK